MQGNHIMSTVRAWSAPCSANNRAKLLLRGTFYRLQMVSFMVCVLAGLSGENSASYLAIWSPTPSPHRPTLENRSQTWFEAQAFWCCLTPWPAKIWSRHGPGSGEGVAEERGSQNPALPELPSAVLNNPRGSKYPMF